MSSAKLSIASEDRAALRASIAALRARGMELAARSRQSRAQYRQVAESIAVERRIVREDFDQRAAAGA